MSYTAQNTELDEDDIVTRLMNSDGRVDELLKEAAAYITELREALVITHNAVIEGTQYHDEASVFNRSPPLTDPPERLRQSPDAA